MRAAEAKTVKPGETIWSTLTGKKYTVASVVLNTRAPGHPAVLFETTDDFEIPVAFAERNP